MRIATGLKFVLCVAVSITTVNAEPMMDPQADRLLRAMGSYLGNAPGFSFRVDEVAGQVLESGAKVQNEVSNRVAVRRPDRFRANSDGDYGAQRIWYDGRSLVVMDYDRMQYQRAEAPQTIDLALDYAATELGLVAPLADLIYSDSYKVLSEHVESGEYLGLHKVRGRDAHHLLFRQQNIDWQIWIAEGWAPLPLKVVIDYKAEPGRPQFIAWISDWDFSVYLPDSLFRADLPADAQPESGEDTAQAGVTPWAWPLAGG